MKGGKIPQHFMVAMSVEEAGHIVPVLRSLLEPEHARYFGLNEAEEENIEALAEALSND